MNIIITGSDYDRDTAALKRCIARIPTDRGLVVDQGQVIGRMTDRLCRSSAARHTVLSMVGQSAHPGAMMQLNVEGLVVLGASRRRDEKTKALIAAARAHNIPVWSANTSPTTKPPQASKPTTRQSTPLQDPSAIDEKAALLEIRAAIRRLRPSPIKRALSAVFAQPARKGYPAGNYANEDRGHIGARP